MTRNKNRFFAWELTPAVFALAWPTMLEQLLQTAVQYVDTAMVGALGTDATAAVGSTTTINWLINSTISAIGIGFLSFISQAMGRKDGDSARRASGQAVLATLVCGVFFTLLTTLLSPLVPVLMQVDPHIRTLSARYFLILYLPMLPRTATIIFGTVLRAAGDTKTPMRVGVVVNIVNVILNFLLIFPSKKLGFFTLPGAGLGVIGAAVASAVAFTVGGVLITAALWRHKTVSPKGQRFSPDSTILKPCLKVAVPNGFQRFGTSLGYVAFAAMVNSLGEISTAAHTIANTVESLFYIPAYGMQTAAATLSGNALGAKDGEKISLQARLLLLLEVLLMVISGAALFIAAPYMMRLFSNDPTVINLGTTVLRMVALSEPFYGVSIIIEGMMQGMGKTVMPFITNIIGMWVVRNGGTFICTQLLSYGLVSAWGCMILHNLLLFVVFSLYWAGGHGNPLTKRKIK